MTIDTNKNSIWLKGDEYRSFYDELKDEKNEGLAPDLFQKRIKACMKALHMKSIKDLNYGHNLQTDHVLSILHHASKQEHHLICSFYKWSSDGDKIEQENNKRLDLAGSLSYELDQIANLKRLPKKSKIYFVQHSDTNKKYYTYTVFYLNERNEPVSLNLKSFGFKFGIVQPSPYLDLCQELGEKIKGDSDYYIKVNL